MIRIGAVWLCLAQFAAAQPGQTQPGHKSWTDYAGGADSSKYVEFNQIHKSNVKQLQVAWTYPVRDGSAYLFNPVIVEDRKSVV